MENKRKRKHKCCICHRKIDGNTDYEHLTLHKYKKEWGLPKYLQDFLKTSALTESQRVCCLHFANHEISAGHRINDEVKWLPESAVNFGMINPPKRSKKLRLENAENSMEKLILKKEQLLKKLASVEAQISKLTTISNDSCIKRQLKFEVDFANDEILFEMFGFSSVSLYRKFLQVAEPKLKSSNHHSYSTLDRLKCFLYVLRTGASSRHMELLSGIPQKSVCRLMEDVSRDLLPLFEENIKLLDIPEWVRHSTRITDEEFKEKLFYFVDGTVLRTNDTYKQNESRLLFNGKHEIPAWVVFLLVSPKGHIAYVSNEVVTGSVFDCTHWNTSTAVSTIENKYREPKIHFENIEYSMCIGADKAYPYMTVPKHFALFITQSGENTVEGTDGLQIPGPLDTIAKSDPLLKDVNFTTKIAKWRSVVERTIGRFKRYQILESFWSDTIDKVSVHVKIVAAILNFTLHHDDVTL